MTLRHLEIFLTVASLQSMTKAAEQLGMSQPAISMSIKELEDYYHTQLFNRMNRKIYLTAKGETLKQYASSILHQYLEVENILRDSNAFHDCKIGINISLGETLLHKIIQLIQSIDPMINLEIKVDNSTKIQSMIENNQLDFAIIDQFDENSSLISLPFLKDEMVIVKKKGIKTNINHIKDLLNYPLLLREKHSGNRNCVDIVFDVYDLKVQPFVESSSDLSILNLVRHGYGLAILPSDLIKQYGNDLEIIKIQQISFIRHFYLIYSKKKYLSDTIQNMIKQLSEVKKRGN